MNIPYILTDNALSISVDGIPHSIPASAPNFKALVTALPCDADTIRPLLDTKSAVSVYTNGRLTVTADGLVELDGSPIDNKLTRRILDFVRSSTPQHAEPLVRFLENVAENPSYRAVQGLAEWVAASVLPITADGRVIAYKVVRDDFRDIHTGTFDNTPGNVLSMPRNQVDEDPDRTCSRGLHVCSTSYLSQYADTRDARVVSVVIHPKDFVAVPRDYECAKARVCEYKVVAEIPRETAAQFFPAETLVHYDTDYFTPPPLAIVSWEYVRGRRSVLVGLTDGTELSIPKQKLEDAYSPSIVVGYGIVVDGNTIGFSTPHRAPDGRPLTISLDELLALAAD